LDHEMATVFISHRIADADLAERLGGEIESAGHRVRLDSREIAIGDSVVEWMNAGLGDAEYVVLGYSVHGVESPWIMREWMSALARQLEGAGVRILPVVLSGGDAPALLADVKAADLTADWAGGVAALLKAIR
jgi:TIR domain